MEPPSTAIAAQEARESSPSRLSVSGTLRRSRSGFVGALHLITGLALLRWLGTALLAMLGHRHEVTLSLAPASLDLEGERRLLGLSLGPSRRVIPLGTIRRATLAAASPGWALLAGAAVVAFCTAAAGMLIIWGLRGQQPSWIALAALLVGVGVLLDALAYLWVRRSARQARATLEILTRHERFRVHGAPQRAAGELLDRLVAQSPRGAGA